MNRSCWWTNDTTRVFRDVDALLADARTLLMQRPSPQTAVDSVTVAAATATAPAAAPEQAAALHDVVTARRDALARLAVWATRSAAAPEG